MSACNNYKNIKPEFSLSSSSLKLDSTGKYLETNYISVNANVDFSTYSVALDMANAQVINQQGEVVQGTLNSNQQFKIRIPIESLSTNDLDLKVSIILDYTEDEVYQFDPPQSEQTMQRQYRL